MLRSAENARNNYSYLPKNCMNLNYYVHQFIIDNFLVSVDLL